MPVGLVRKWLLVGTLAAVGATGCKDDSTDEPTPAHDGGGGGGNDAGHMDAGAGNDGGGGGGTDAGKDGGAGDSGGPSVMCGTLTCTGHSTPVATFAPGCATNAADATVCGISTASLLDGGEPKFLQKDAPGVASPSCAEVIDMNEPPPAEDAGADAAVTKGNHLIDTTLMLGALKIGLTYPGCCTEKGFCSGNTMMGKASLAGMAPMDSNGGFGCMDSEIFFVKQVQAGHPEAAHIACNKTTGDFIPPDAGGTDSGAGDGGSHDAGADAGDGG